MILSGDFSGKWCCLEPVMEAGESMKIHQNIIEFKTAPFGLLVLSILLYGAESCATAQKRKNELNAFGKTCYKILLNIRRIDRVTKKYILNATQRKHVSEVLPSKQLQVLRHCLRIAPEITMRKYALYT